MYERYMVNPEEIKNVEKNGQVTGFYMRVKSPYYKNVLLDNIAMLQVRVDNMVFTEDDITFSINGKTYTMNEMETINTHHWKSDEKAIVFVPLKGGISTGTHIVEIGVGIRENKCGNIRPTSNVCYITS